MSCKPISPTQGLGFGLGCAPGAIPGGLTRTRFYDGMFLTQADLENEQLFWRMKRRLTNRALGAGVVWGLRLTFDAATKRFRLSPGYAIDCCGNDLVVECPIEVSEAELLQRSQELLGGSSLSNSANNPAYCVVLQYVECPDAIRPVHRDACSPAGTSCEPSRIRETCRLMLVPKCSTPMDCGTAIGGLITRVKAASGDTEETQPSDASWTKTIAGGQDKAGALLFTALSAFLRTSDRTKASPSALLGASMLLSNVSSGMLGFDLEAAGPDATTTVNAATDEVFAQLCDGLLYPGPRCHDTHHGVYLGCMRNDERRGRIFDMWQCRREVLTGPLLNWWLCLFGIPPIDTWFNILGEIVCAAEETEDPQGGIIEKVVAMKTAAGAMVSDRREVSPVEMYTSIARMLLSRADGVGLVKLEATAPNGKPMSMIVPAAAAGGDSTGEVDRRVHAMLVDDRTIQPLSRGPLRDLVGEIARRARMSAVATNVDADVVKALGPMTVSGLLAAEPEAVLAKIGGTKPTDAQRTAVNDLYTSAENFLRGAVAAAAPAGKAGVARTQLAKNTELKSALKKATGVSAGLLDEAIGAAAKR